MNHKHGGHPLCERDSIIISISVCQGCAREVREYLPTKGSKFNGTETPIENKIRLHKKGVTQLRFQQKEIEIERGPLGLILVFCNGRWLDRYSG